MNLEEKSWFNQSLLYHRDQEFNTNSTLDIAISNNTSDYKSYSPITFNIGITNQTRRFFTISYTLAYDLLQNFKLATDSINKSNRNPSDKIEILRKSYDKNLLFTFSTLNNQIIVGISILQSGDSVMILIPYSVFLSIASLLKSYSSEYIKLNIEFTNRSAIIDVLDEMKKIKNNIKIIPSSIENMLISPTKTTESNNSNNSEKEYYKTNDTLNNNNNNNETSDELYKFNKEYIENTEKESLDFETYFKENINSINIPELEKVSEIEGRKNNIELTDKNSIYDILDGNLNNLENIISTISISNNPIESLKKIILDKIDPSSTFELIPGMNENDYKSTVYMSKSIFSYFFNNYVKNNVQIPSSIPIIKYNPQFNTELNMALAYDILLVSSYVRCVRNKLYTRDVDSTKNKSVFYLGIRLFLDFLSFSFIDNIDFNVVKSCVLERFKIYEGSGFFDYYTKLLNSFNLQEVTSMDISYLLDEISNKVIGKVSSVEQSHTNNYNNNFLRLPYNSNLNLEQIINYVIPAQVAIYNNFNDLEDHNGIEKFLRSMNDIPNDIVLILLDKKEKNRISNLTKIVNKYIDEVPKQYRDSFIFYISTLKDSFDLNDSRFPIEEFGENIIKGIYIWNESEKNESLSNFLLKFEESVMSKDLILLKYRSIKNNETSNDIENSDVSTDNWEDLLNL